MNSFPSKATALPGQTAADTLGPSRVGKSSPFAFNGLVGLRRLSGGEWQDSYKKLEAISNEFRALFPRWGRGYPWPEDPLRYWFRPFEYPYVVHNLPQADEHHPPVVADIGSAITFFSFFMAQRGYLVKCVDSDRRMLDFWHRVGKCIPEHWKDPASRIEYHIAEDSILPFGISEMDAVTCISVLEHVSDPPRLIAEMLRVLKPGGSLILTMDVSLESDRGVSPENFYEICRLLGEECAPVHPTELVHPQELLVQPGIPEDLVSAAGKPWTTIGYRVMAWKVGLRRFLRDGYSARSLCLFVGTYIKC